MRVTGRLRKLESRFDRVVDSLAPAWSDPEWHAVFADKGRDDFFRGEPDFARALTDYSRAITAAERIAPEVDPPRDFRQYHPRRTPTLFTWRNDTRFPEVAAVFEWLCTMTLRVCDRKPAVSEAAFADVATWFHANEPRLRDRCAGTGRLDTGDGASVVLSDLAFAVAAGPRQVESGRTAATIRRLQRAFEQGRLVEAHATSPVRPPGDPPLIVTCNGIVCPE